MLVLCQVLVNQRWEDLAIAFSKSTAYTRETGPQRDKNDASLKARLGPEMIEKYSPQAKNKNGCKNSMMKKISKF